MYSAKFRVKHEDRFTGVSIFTGSFNIYKNHILIDSFPVMSGKYGKGALPYGKYLLSAPIRLKDVPQNNSFRKEGFPWLAVLHPQFKTERTDLCVHPDGGVYGTLGCAGIEDRDVSCFEILEIPFKTTKFIPFIVEKYVEEKMV